MPSTVTLVLFKIYLSLLLYLFSETKTFKKDLDIKNLDKGLLIMLQKRLKKPTTKMLQKTFKKKQQQKYSIWTYTCRQNLYNDNDLWKNNIYYLCIKCVYPVRTDIKTLFLKRIRKKKKRLFYKNCLLRIAQYGYCRIC